MATGHLLTNIQQQGIVAILSNVNRSFKNITLAHLTTSAFGSGNIHYFSDLRLGV